MSAHFLERRILVALTFTNAASFAKLVGSAVRGMPWNGVELFEVPTAANALSLLQTGTPALGTTLLRGRPAAPTQLNPATQPLRRGQWCSVHCAALCANGSARQVSPPGRHVLLSPDTL